MKSIFAAVVLALVLLAVPAAAGVPAIDPGNHTRTYGYVVLVNSDPTFPDGFIYVHVPSLGDTVRLDFLYADKSGAHELTVNQWVAIDGYLDSEVGCVDGPNTEVRPLIVYRWTGSSWQRYDHDSLTWTAW